MIATFQTCLSFISCLSKVEVENSATEIYQKAEQKDFQIKLANSPRVRETTQHVEERTEQEPKTDQPPNDLIEW